MNFLPKFMRLFTKLAINIKNKSLKINPFISRPGANLKPCFFRFLLTIEYILLKMDAIHRAKEMN